MSDPLTDFVDPYPLHTKLIENKPRITPVTEFYEWLRDHGYHLVSYDPLGHDVPAPFFRDLLADWLGIDQTAFEAEKMAMLDKLRELNTQLIGEVKSRLNNGSADE